MFRSAATRAYAFLGLVLSLLTACSAPPPPEPAGSAQFEAMVLDLLPGFEVRPQQIDPSYRKARIYAFGAGVLSQTGPRDVFIGNIEKFESVGLPPSTLYVEDKIARTYAKTEFPGCAPGGCVAVMASLPIAQVPMQEFARIATNRGLSAGTKTERREVASATIDGIEFNAQLVASINAFGGVSEYSLRLQRVALTTAEKTFANTHRASSTHPIPILVHRRNLVLGTVETQRDPSWFATGTMSSTPLFR